jgi:citrate lyase gamma subunit
MRSVLSCRRSCDARAAASFIAVTALSLIFVAGVVPTSSHAQPLPQTNAQNQSRNVPALDARDLPAQTLFNQALSMERESPEKAMAKYDEVMQRYGRATPGARQLAARALLNKGGILVERGDTQDAIVTYERIERNFGNEKIPAIREVLASALVSKAEALYKQNKDNPEKTLAAYAQLEQQFGKDDSDFIKRLVDIAKWRATEIRVESKMSLSTMK